MRRGLGTAGWAAAFVGVLAFALGAPAQAAPIAETSAGRVAGALEGDVVAFKAIPYAAPPTGPLRWRPPQAPASWSGVRAGDRFGPVCPQTLQPPPTGLPNQSEDCLTVNVFAPAGVKAGAKLSVMVWIHGGGFTVGAGGQPFYDGAALARRGVVVVTLNYRLGRLGFFAHPALVREAGADGLFGNYGLMDQIAALTWVQRNITAFGGDPHRVTAFGESAGGIALNTLMVTPAAKGLFQQAIVESGLGRNPARSLKSAEASDTHFAIAEGISGEDPAALMALRALPVAAFVPAHVGMTDPDQPGPMIDGRLVTTNVAEGFAAGRAAKIPFIIGTNDHEDSLFPSARKRPETVLNAIPSEQLGRLKMACFPGATPTTADIAGAYVVDSLFTEPARFLAHAQAAQGKPVWRYRFGYVQTDLRGKTAGASHAAEVQFVFGSLGVRGPTPTIEDLEVADILQLYWTNFAKTGDPNGLKLSAWPKDADNQDEVLLIETGKPSFSRNYRQRCLDFFHPDN